MLRTVLGTLFSLFLNAVLAFIISRKEFVFQRSLSLFWVITMYVNGGLIPVFLLYKALGLTNSFWVYVIPRRHQLLQYAGDPDVHEQQYSQQPGGIRAD